MILNKKYLKGVVAHHVISGWHVVINVQESATHQTENTRMLCVDTSVTGSCSADLSSNSRLKGHGERKNCHLVNLGSMSQHNIGVCLFVESFVCALSVTRKMSFQSGT